jgi:hypothetical protein
MGTQTADGRAPANRLTPQIALLFLGIALLFDLIGFCIVPARTDYSSNSAFYIQMAQHGTGSVEPPFRYRALVPSLARLLPLPADQGLLAISHVSLIGCLFLAMLICRRVGLSVPACIFGAAALFCSRAFVYNYVNPYMTDAVALLAMFVMVYSYIGEQPAAFVIAAFVGILAHEITVFLVPAALFTRRWKRGLAICLVSAFVLVLTRFWLGGGYAGNLKREFHFFSYHVSHPAELIRGAVLTWYALWPLFVMGIIMLPAKRFRLLVCSLLLTGGAVFLSSFVLDTERTYSILAPVVAVGAAVVFERLWQRSYARALGLLIVVLAEIASTQAYRTGAGNLRLLAVCTIPAILYLAYAFVVCLSQMREGLRRHATEIRQFAAGVAPE